ncbi:transmembrane protein 116-like [Scleropages formosus]|uniref:Transmembrane protein 116-like n=1 Tax=Scleropages formosus TaxID=113540 RepID=A0A0P7WC93_SCLFO|nr:transmembrane protein 116-like [Scleropages formosus]
MCFMLFFAYYLLVFHVQVRPLFFLSVTDMLLSLSWLVGAVLFTQSCSSPGACYNLHIIEQARSNSPLFQFPEMTSLFGCIAIVLSWTIQQLSRFPVCLPIFLTTRLSLLASSVFPLLLMVPVLAVGNSDQCYTNFSQPYNMHVEKLMPLPKTHCTKMNGDYFHCCWLHRCLLMHRGALYPTSRYRNELTSCHMVHVYGIAVFLATFLFTFMGIVVSSFSLSPYLSVTHCSCSMGLQDKAVFLAAMILFSPKTVQGKVGVFLYILQAFTSASQGLLNCLVYSWTQQQFRSLSRGAMRDVDTQTPLLRSQKSYAALHMAGTKT